MINPLVILFLILSTTLLTSCSSTGSASAHYSVYGSYGYPYNSYGGAYRPYPVVVKPVRPNRPNRPDRPGTLPVQRPSAGMGRPSGSFGAGSRRR